MEAWQIRQETLIPGSCDLLSQKHVIVLGIGGVGAALCEALARAGVGRFTLVDSDEVSESNINRQIIAFQNTVGRSKTEVMKELILSINPKAQVRCFDEFVDGERASELCRKSGADFICDAVDTVSVKLSLALWAQESGISIISAMGTGNKLHPELFEIADIYDTSVCPLCRAVRVSLKKMGVKKLTVVYSKELPQKAVADWSNGRHAPASVSFTPPAAGYVMAGYVVRTLLDIE